MNQSSHGQAGLSHQDVYQANAEYYDQVAESYFDNETYAYTPDIVNDIKRLLAIGASRAASNELFLDFGCGSGFLSKLVSEGSLFERGFGVDASAAQVALYNKRLANPKFQAERGDINALNLADNTVDMAGGYSVLHHIHNYWDSLTEITRVLKPGGVFYVDFEPNRQFKTLFNIPIRVRRYLFDRAPIQDGDTLESMAEYHNNYEPGIDYVALKEWLSARYEIIDSGCRVPSLFGARVLKALSSVSFVFSPCFWFLAVKK